MRFTATLEPGGKTATGIEVPAEVVDVDLELDTEPCAIEVPRDLMEALAEDDEAKAFFDALSYSKQQWHVLSVEGAKTSETRQRRIEKSVAMLHENRAR